MTAFLWLSETEAKALHHVLERVMPVRRIFACCAATPSLAADLRAITAVEPIMLRLGDMLLARADQTEAAGVPPRLGGAGAHSPAPAELNPPRAAAAADDDDAGPELSIGGARSC